MSHYCKVVLMGNLTRDAELRYLPSGSPVLDLGLAVNFKYKGPDGALREEVSYITVKKFGAGGEKLVPYLKKGTGLLVEGRLRQHRWEKPAGEKHSKIEVISQSIMFLPRPGGRAGPGAQPEAPAEEFIPEDGLLGDPAAPKAGPIQRPRRTPAGRGPG